MVVSVNVCVLVVLLLSFKHTSLITCSIVGLHHVPAFFSFLLDKLRTTMAVNAEHVPEVRQSGCLSCAVSR